MSDSREIILAKREGFARGRAVYAPKSHGNRCTQFAPCQECCDAARVVYPEPPDGHAVSVWRLDEGQLPTQETTLTVAKTDARK